MKKLYIIAAVAVALFAGGALAIANNSDESTEASKQKVAATIYPLYDITKEIAGDEFDVVLMLPAGASPHTFDPQPSLLKELEGSRAAFSIGNGLDNWVDDLADSVGAEKVVVDTNVDLLETKDSHDDHDDHGDEDHEDHEEEGHDGHGEEDHHDDEEMYEDHDDESHEDHEHSEDDHSAEDKDHDEHDHEDDDHGDEDHEDEDSHEGHDHGDEDHEDEDSHEGHDHGPIDPHYWLSIHNAEKIAMTIAGELSALDSENASLYTERANEYAEELEELEAELRAKTSTLNSTNIISLHDAWYYFAADFKLNIVGTFEPSAGEEPTPQYLANLQEEVDENDVTAIFAEPQLSTASINTFAEDNDLSIATIDPLGGVEGRDSYIELMRYNVDQVVSALK